MRGVGGFLHFRILLVLLILGGVVWAVGRFLPLFDFKVPDGRSALPVGQKQPSSGGAVLRDMSPEKQREYYRDYDKGSTGR